MKRAVWGEAPDDGVLRKAREEEIPQILDFLEGEVPDDAFLFGEISLADIAIGSFFRNAGFARFTVDAQRWPKTATFVSRVLGHDALARLRVFEELLMRTPVQMHRTALRDAGAPIAAESFATSTPRRGVIAV